MREYTPVTPNIVLSDMCANCNTLQHTATHRNTPQHTATHRNTLQHTVTHYNTLQHTTAHYNTLQHTATHCNTGVELSNKHASDAYNALSDVCFEELETYPTTISQV